MNLGLSSATVSEAQTTEGFSPPNGVPCAEIDWRGNEEE